MSAPDRQQEPAALRDRIRAILLNDWDPHDAQRTDAAHHTYDGYISPLANLIRSSADEDAIIAFLKEREAETMCFPALGTRRLANVAKKLIALRAGE
jgi:hypothetical protein